MLQVLLFLSSVCFLCSRGLFEGCVLPTMIEKIIVCVLYCTGTVLYYVFLLTTFLEGGGEGLYTTHMREGGDNRTIWCTCSRSTWVYVHSTTVGTTVRLSQNRFCVQYEYVTCTHEVYLETSQDSIRYCLFEMYGHLVCLA